VTAAAEPVCKVADHAPPGWPHLLPRSALEVGSGRFRPMPAFLGRKKSELPLHFDIPHYKIRLYLCNLLSVNSAQQVLTPRDAILPSAKPTPAPNNKNGNSSTRPPRPLQQHTATLE